MLSTITRIGLFATVIAIASCGGGTEEGARREGGKQDTIIIDTNFREVRVENSFSMELPGYLNKTDSLLADASLQYKSDTLNAFMITMEEMKTDFIAAVKDAEGYDPKVPMVQTYRSAYLSIFSTNNKVRSVSQPRAMKINGLDAETVEVTANTQGIKSDIYYLLTFIEGKDKIYAIMAWTIPQNKQALKRDFERAALSFRELEGSASSGK